MTKLEVFAHGKTIGTAEVRQEGLFLAFSAALRQEGDTLLRLYAVSGWHSEYLGIPCPAGEEMRLNVRLPASHFPSPPTVIAADSRPRDEWMPWCGELDGIPVHACRIQNSPEGPVLAMAAEEAEQFPQWLSHMEEAELGGESVRLLRLNPDGSVTFPEEEEVPQTVAAAEEEPHGAE